jgi:uncharacterized protein DUF11
VRTLGLSLVCGLVVLVSASTAPARRDAAADVSIDIAVGTVDGTPQGTPKLIPRGGTASSSSLSFKTGIWLEDVGPDPTANVSFRFVLPSGLRWGNHAPDASEGCTSTSAGAECSAPRVLNPANPGDQTALWKWDVLADAPGSYVLHAEILAASPSDPNSSNNSSSVTAVVTQTVKASVVKVSPTRPRAGAVVTARVGVVADGSPITPASVACAGSIGRMRLAGRSQAKAAAATCRYRTPRTAAGKILRGTVTVLLTGEPSITRHFAVKLR